MRTDMEYPTDKKSALNLYTKYINMALETRLKGDRALFEDYYQRAEDYLRLMNKLNNNVSSTSPLPFKKNSLHYDRKKPRNGTVEP